jgi:hypothetical protein
MHPAACFVLTLVHGIFGCAATGQTYIVEQGAQQRTVITDDGATAFCISGDTLRNALIIPTNLVEAYIKAHREPCQ